jgi:hypothetical protein
VTKKFLTQGTLVYKDEYAIYQSLDQWGYEHKSVCYGTGEYARDEDGDGFHEVYVNTMEISWTSEYSAHCSLHRVVSQAFSGVLAGLNVRREYPYRYHELHHDLNYQEVLVDIEAWLNRHL